MAALQKKILAAYDGSNQALAALQMAADFARALEAKLVVVYVVPPYTFPVDFYGQGVADLTQQHRAWAEQMLDKAVKDFRERGYALEPLLLNGGPAEEITRAAEADDVWLVVVGSSGRGAVSRVLLGSVADRVVHLCKKPVLVVR
ncbi:MAG: universal stress protein [Myxococcaceae bacterium]